MTTHTSSLMERGALLPILIAAALLAAPWPLTAGECSTTTDECLRGMREKIAERGWLGIEYEEEGEGGLPKILKVMENSPAAEGGLQPGDTLLSINGVSYDNPRETIYSEVKKALVPGNEVQLLVDRDGDEVELTIVAGHVPDTVAAQWVGRHLMEYHSEGDEVADADDTDDES